jgi:hypothetical protein
MAESRRSKQLTLNGKPFRLLRLDDTRGMEAEALGFGKTIADLLKGVRFSPSEADQKEAFFAEEKVASRIAQSFGLFDAAAKNGNVAVHKVQVQAFHEFLENGEAKRINPRADVFILAEKSRISMAENLVRQLAEEGDPAIALTDKSYFRDSILADHVPKRKSGKGKFQKYSGWHVMGEPVFFFLKEDFLYSLYGVFDPRKKKAAAENQAPHIAAEPSHQAEIHLLGMGVLQEGGKSPKDMAFPEGLCQTFLNFSFFPESAGKSLETPKILESFNRLARGKGNVCIEVVKQPAHIKIQNPEGEPVHFSRQPTLYLIAPAGKIPLAQDVVSTLLSGTHELERGDKRTQILGGGMLSSIFSEDIFRVCPSGGKPRQIDAWYDPENDYFIVQDRPVHVRGKRNRDQETISRLCRIFSLPHP